MIKKTKWKSEESDTTWLSRHLIVIRQLSKFESMNASTKAKIINNESEYSISKFLRLYKLAVFCIIFKILLYVKYKWFTQLFHQWLNYNKQNFL